MAKITKLKVQFCSLVDSPANDKPAIFKSTKGLYGDRFELALAIKSKTIKEGLLYGIVYEPDTVDLQGDWADADTIKIAAHEFLQYAYQFNVDIQHDFNAGKGTVVESFILNGDDPRFPATKKGSWCVIIKLSPEAIERADEINGISLAGYVQYDTTAEPPKTKTKNKTMIPTFKSLGKAIRNLRLEADKTEKQVATVLGFEDVAAYAAFENEATDAPAFVFDEEKLNSFAKLIKQSPASVAIALMNEGEAPSEDTPEEDAPAEDAPQEDAPAEDAPDAGKSVGDKKTPAKKTEPAKKSVPPARKKLSATKVKVEDVTETNKSTRKEKMTFEEKKDAIGAHIVKSAKNILVAKGYYTETDFDFDDALSPTLGTELISVAVEQSGFFSHVQRVEMSSLLENVPVADVSDGGLTRLTPGENVSAGANNKTVNLSKQLHCHEVDYPYFFPFVVFDNYQGNLPDLRGKLADLSVLNYTNQMLRLGFIGTTDTFDNTHDYTLSKGWYQRAVDEVDAGMTVDISADVSSGNILDIMDAAIDKMVTNKPQHSDAPTMSFVMGAVDFNEFEKEIIGLSMPNEGVLMKGASRIYRGKNIFVVPYLTEGKFLMAKPENFLFGLVTRGSNGTRFQTLEKEKGIQNILSSALDYDFVDYTQIVLVKP